jgi:PPOX class probable FMN-dependent enzyme
MAQFITSEAELTALYGPHDTVVATIKEIDHISDHYRAFIEVSPFVVVATMGPEGLDCSPRGDPPGFVRVIDKHTVMLPDRRGNNRIDTLRNIVRDPRISLLFLIPGIGRTLRINGRAAIRVDAELCASFTLAGKVARSVIVVTAERVYTQCPKALIRSKLWDPNQQLDEKSLPSPGTIMQALQANFAGEEWDRNYAQRTKDTLY